MNTPRPARSEINSLYEAAKRGTPDAEARLFEFLLVRFRFFTDQRIWNRDEAEDVIQNALAVILEEYRDISITSSFSAWAYKVLDNRVLSYIQQKGRRDRLLREEIASGSLDGPSPSSDNPGLERRLRECLKKIGRENIRYARILNLSYQGYKTDEICERLDITPNNLYVILSRARSMLKRCLESGRIDG